MNPRSESTDRTGRQDDNGARGVRVVAISLAAGFFLLIGAFVLMVFFVQDEARLNAVGPIAPAPGQERGGLVFAGTANIWEIRGRMTLDDTRQVRFDFDLTGPTGIPAPDTLEIAATLDMPEHDMAPIRVPIARGGSGAFATGAALPQPGKWRLRIELPEITGVFVFDVDP